MKKIFLSSAMDNRTINSINSERNYISSLFNKYNVELIYAEKGHYDKTDRITKKLIAKNIVKSDISLLLQCDALFFDYSLDNHDYIGCISEITYAKIFNIPVVIYCGGKLVDDRWWLIYHSEYITDNMHKAIKKLVEIIS